MLFHVGNVYSLSITIVVMLVNIQLIKCLRIKTLRVTWMTKYAKCEPNWHTKGSRFMEFHFSFIFICCNSVNSSEARRTDSGGWVIELSLQNPKNLKILWLHLIINYVIMKVSEEKTNVYFIYKLHFVNFNMSVWILWICFLEYVTFIYSIIYIKLL